MRICPECNVEKDDEEFYKKLNKPLYRCKICVNKLHKTPIYVERRRKRSNENYHKNKEKFSERNKRYRVKNFQRKLWLEIRKRAKRTNIEFDLDVEDIKLITFCPVLNIPIILCGQNSEQSISIDRIDNNKGYTKGNIVIVSNRANKLKKDATLQELWSVYDRYKKLREKKQELIEI